PSLPPGLSAGYAAPETTRSNAPPTMWAAAIVRARMGKEAIGGRAGVQADPPRICAPGCPSRNPGRTWAPMRVAFTACEYHADRAIQPATYAFVATSDGGWEVSRDGLPHLRLGTGYRLLRVSHCGVCATDLARHALPFPLPQILGHEVVAVDDDGTPVVVDINASHAAPADPAGAACGLCRSDLPSHFPQRLVLGAPA